MVVPDMSERVGGGLGKQGRGGGGDDVAAQPSDVGEQPAGCHLEGGEQAHEWRGRRRTRSGATCRRRDLEMVVEEVKRVVG